MVARTDFRRHVRLLCEWVSLLRSLGRGTVLSCVTSWLMRTHRINLPCDYRMTRYVVDRIHVLMINVSADNVLLVLFDHHWFCGKSDTFDVLLTATCDVIK